MAHSIIWSNEALEDIEGIAMFISRDSIYYAQQVVSRLFLAGESLVEQPGRGHKVPELNNPAIRELFV